MVARRDRTPEGWATAAPPEPRRRVTRRDPEDQEGWGDVPTSALEHPYLRLIQVLVLAGVIGYALLQLGFLEDEPRPVTVSRIAAEDPVSAAATVAREIYGDGTTTVILIGAESIADGVVATGLSGALDAPVLLTDARLLSTPTREVIVELRATEAIIIGGNASIAPVLARSLEVDLEMSVTRIAGASRFETAALVAAAFGQAREPVQLPELGRAAMIVPADQPSLALEAGALASSDAGPMPVLLSQDGQLPEPTTRSIDALQIEHLVVIGDPVTGFAGTTTLVEPLTGPATATAELRGFEPSRIVLVPSGDDARTLVASRLAGSASGTVLPSGPAAIAWLEARCNTVAEIIAFGSEALLPQRDVDAALAAAISCQGEGS